MKHLSRYVLATALLFPIGAIAEEAMSGPELGITAAQPMPELSMQEKIAVAVTLHKEFMSLTTEEKEKLFKVAVEVANSLSPETLAKFRAHALGKLEAMTPQQRTDIEARFKERWDSLTPAQKAERRAEAHKRFASAQKDQQDKFKSLVPAIHAALIVPAK